ncbi:class I adenylate-forming enzyme family protein [Pseudobutyrivibrio xylanivorans]|uniref:class I adenylate-forming enzyme family protein n=1 Tax=Pseudobutyrivibrio xylanivorans TaxID=185007 RepID=UPI00142EC631|nr:class I adenylate-forming enzyme family protein [Pseudobutyrivibrio xylanivorans]
MIWKKMVAIEYLGLKVTYEQLFKKIDQTGRALKAVGVNQGDIVSVCLPNIPEAIYLLYAINKIGAVANMLDVRCGAPTLEKAINDADSKVLLYLDSITDKFENVRSNTTAEVVVAVSPIEGLSPALRFIVRCKDKELRQNIPAGVFTWKAFTNKAQEFTGTIDGNSAGNNDAVIAYTGGTTGEPKGVIGTNYNVNAVVEMEFKVGFNQSEHDSFLCMAPPWTYYGICNSINVPFCMGLKVILVPKFGPDDLGELILKYKPNHVVTVPSSVGVLLSGKYENADFSYLHSLILGADKLDESLEIEVNNYLQSHGASIRVSKGYGMTEVMAAAAYSRLNANEIGSVGVPYPLNNISAFKETDHGYEECKIGEQGEIAIIGPTVMKSYFGKFENENVDILKKHEDGTTWAHTGDIGYIGADGRVYIVGRLKRMFVKAGFKVFPATIEHCIMTNETVQVAAVVSVKDKYSGYATKAFVVLKDNSADKKIVQSEIEKIVTDELYDYELPDIYEFVDKLPLTGMGKVDYRALEEMG